MHWKPFPRSRSRAACLALAAAAALAGCRGDGPVSPDSAQARRFLSFDFGANGLPQPTPGPVGGARGYTQLLGQLNADASAVWATSALLQGERDFAARGGSVKRYLSTAWVWFENGSASRPDPYLINCQPYAAHQTPVHALCGSQYLYQVAGWQARDRYGNVLTEFRRFWTTDAELRQVLAEVQGYSSKATRPNWNYNDPGQQTGLVALYRSQVGNAVIGDLWPNPRGYDDGRSQYFSVLAGKHPRMVAALNSYVVNDAGLVNALRTQPCAYGYICAVEKQVLANMVAALILFENGQLLPPADPFSLVSQMHGRCLDAPSPANGTRVHMWDCVGNANQRWTYYPATGELKVHGNKCLDAWTSRLLDTVVVHDCHGMANQKWDLAGDDRIRLRGQNLCIDIDNLNRGYGAKLLLYHCHRGENQLWRQSPGGNGGSTVGIVSDLTFHRCADSPGSASGTPLHLWECLGPGHPNQRFVRTVDRELKVFGRCVEGQGTTNNAPVVVADCNGGPRQKWDLLSNGDLRGSSGLCIDVAGGGTALGTRLVLWTCHGGANQKWSFTMPRA